MVENRLLPRVQRLVERLHRGLGRLQCVEASREELLSSVHPVEHCQIGAGFQLITELPLALLLAPRDPLYSVPQWALFGAEVELGLDKSAARGAPGETVDAALARISAHHPAHHHALHISRCIIGPPGMPHPPAPRMDGPS